jgi:uncharacterized protein YuzE
VRRPVSVRVDLEVDVAYVGYRRLADEEHIARSERISEDVVVDYDAAGEIVGLELLGLDELALKPAREFASRRDLAFPADALTLFCRANART